MSTRKHCPRPAPFTASDFHVPAVEVDAQAQLADDATLRWLDGELARVDAEARSVDIDEEGL